MGFPNVDVFLVDTFLEKFAAMKLSPTFVIDDTFTDFDAGRKSELEAYIARKTFTDDLRNRIDQQVYIMPNFPLADMPFPQIAVTLGSENPSERFLSDSVGDSTPVYDVNNVQIAWDIPKGYIGSATYKIDVVTATKEEAIWISRLLQRFILESQDALAEIGALSVDLTMQDMRLEQEQAPITVFNRSIQMTCRTENTWTIRIPYSQYGTGQNQIGFI